MGEAEKSSLGIVQIILHVIAAVLCFAVLVAAALTISTLDDIVGDSDSTLDEERRYRGVGGWLVFLGVAGLIVEIVMVIVRGLHYGEIISGGFVAFGIVNAVFSAIFALGLIAGGVASAVNAADIQDDIDVIEVFCEDPANDRIEEICNDFEQLRNSMAAAAALSFLGAAIFIALTIVTVMGVVKSRQ